MKISKWVLKSLKPEATFADIPENSVLKNFATFTGQRLCWSLFRRDLGVSNVKGFRLVTFLKKRL